MLHIVLTCFRLQEVFGGNAVSDEYGIGRHVANLFVTQTYEGQSDIHGKFPSGMYPDGN
jgi:alkylation response protein AidB-like acyl-CoA dehydrogenase